MEAAGRMCGGHRFSAGVIMQESTNCVRERISIEGQMSEEASRDLTKQDALSAQSQPRNRRRGVIEKRRRDRINSSLAELRRLLPSAFEKQGSQRLEKAEIIHMAVQYLRSAATKGWNNSFVTAAEYHSMGFRFCASEVDEFLSNEGVELHHPLRLRLNNHLQCFSAQGQNAFNGSLKANLTAVMNFSNTAPLAPVPPEGARNVEQTM